MLNQKTYSWFFYLCALEGVLAIWALLLIPTEGGRISTSRAALIVILLAIVVFWTYLGIRPPHSLTKLAHPTFIILSALLALVFSLILFLLRYLQPERFLYLYLRLSPLLWYLLLLSIQTSFFLLVSYKGFHTSNLASRKPVYVTAFIVFCILLSIFVLISITRLGLMPDTAYWAEPGVPILGWQFALALLGGIFIFILSFYLKEYLLDKILPLLIYAFAIALWLTVPTNVLTRSFYMPMTRPTFEPFPYSDSIYYDQMAQSLLIGNPYFGEIPSRPLYVTFLTLLHYVIGEDYVRILTAQTLALALIPVALYYLGRKLHSHTAGVIVALFFIFREFTSLLVSSETRVTNTRMILVDLPTLLLLLLSCIFTMRWLEKRDNLSALCAGGVFGLLLLLRTQSMLILPIIILMAFLMFGWRNRSSYVAVAWFFPGLILSILPWLMHNYILTGKIAFDADFQYKVLASQYAYSGNLDLQSVDLEGKSLPLVLIEFALRDPGFVFGFISNHFLATQIHGLLVLPLIEPYYGIRAPLNLYWMEWTGQLEWYNVLLLIVYLTVIAFGLGVAWKRWRWMGLLPLVFSLGYTLSAAVGRFSGWRYDFPADWIWYFYFGIGFAELLVLFALLFGSKTETTNVSHSVPIGSSQVRDGVVFALIFFLVGALPWLIEKISPPRYSEQSPRALGASIASLSNAPSRDDIEMFTLQPDSFLQEGRLLYPRFFNRNNGLSSSTPSPAYAIREYPRLGFLLINEHSTSAVFPAREMPGPVPHAADVIVLGCRREDYVDVRLLALPELNAVYLSAPLDQPCIP
ncbi:MAG TPA: glycosyltransferase family 39 protein [Anaerolineales bacterium]|nr:glycosyltransferase family 39 protein [Anaerolineales bacterium]